MSIQLSLIKRQKLLILIKWTNTNLLNAKFNLFLSSLWIIFQTSIPITVWYEYIELISVIPLHMDKQRQNDQLEPIYNSSVPTQDVALKTDQERWTIERGGGRASERSALVTQHYEYIDLIIWMDVTQK